MDKPSDIQAVGNEVAAVLLQRLAQSHIDDPEGRSLGIRVARLEANVESILVTLRDFREDFRDFKKSVDERFAAIEAKFDAKFESAEAKSEARFAAVDAKFDAMLRQSRQDFYILVGFMIGMLGVMAKGFHWL